MEKEIIKLFDIGTTKLTSLEKNVFLSPVLLLPKCDAFFFRMILNLSRLNESIPPNHFNLDTFRTSFLD